MFLDSGDGVVFVGEFGPWYSEERREFHLTREAARNLLTGTIETYMAQEGRELKEVFLHARSGLNREEFEGFSEACPEGVKLVGIRVRKDRFGPRLFRHDDHADVTRRGMHPILRGTFWQRTQRHGLLFTSGFKPRIATYDGWEIPIPLSITIQHGDADLIQVATDILGLTKLNYNSCQLGESQPITVKYSDRIGEVLLANPELPREQWRTNFKFYI
jgi:argonaute-like protein implicated in RNA metabolism and viral defense